MPSINVYLDPDYMSKLDNLRNLEQGETKLDVATKLLKKKIDEEFERNDW